MITFLLIMAGLVLLYLGAEGLVRGSASMALRFGIAPLAVGLTIVAFGTSAPELVVSLKAVLNNSCDLAVGNVVGSNIFNIAVILGLTALIRPVRVKQQVLKRDAPIMIGASIILLLMISDKEISHIEGIFLASGIVTYTIISYILSKKDSSESDAEFTSPGKSILLDLLFIIAGLASLVFGSNFLVTGAIQVAKHWGVSEAIIGLTIVAAGTSLPELATSIVAAIRGHDDIAIGNIVGSNIFNILCILGFSSFVAPIQIGNIGILDLGFMTGVALLLFPFMLTKLKLDRIEGMVLLATYGVYMYFLWPAK